MDNKSLTTKLVCDRIDITVTTNDVKNIITFDAVNLTIQLF